jgi:hypothetical protein
MTIAAFAAVLATIPEICRQYAYQIYSDTYKDHYGVRPRFAANWSLAKLEARTEDLYDCDCYECQEWKSGAPSIPTGGEGWAFVPATAEGAVERLEADWFA